MTIKAILQAGYDKTIDWHRRRIGMDSKQEWQKMIA